jgi:hypothetical protein
LIYFDLNSAKNHLQFCLILYWESKQPHNWLSIKLLNACWYYYQGLTIILV